MRRLFSIQTTILCFHIATDLFWLGNGFANDRLNPIADAGLQHPTLEKHRSGRQMVNQNAVTYGTTLSSPTKEAECG